MYRVKLINEIERDLLELNKDSKISTIQDKVNTYSQLLEDNIRNYYELESMDEYCPLFRLCYNLKNGKDCFGIDEDEFNEMNLKLLKILNNKYEVNYTLS